MKIDTHQHFWKLERGDYRWLTSELEPLYRDFLPQDLAPLLRASDMQATIAVQAADSEAETEYLLSLADQHNWIIGVVGWVDLAAPTAVASINRLAQHPKLLGLRPMIQDIDDDTWMLDRALHAALAAMVAHKLSFDALVLPRHLGHLDDFLTQNPDLSVVIDHCAKPQIGAQNIEPWATQISAIAQHTNVFCKISGLVTEAAPQWQVDDLDPFVAHVVKAFGPNRLLFGSDWPVLNLASNYAQWRDIFEDMWHAHTPHLPTTTLDDNAFTAYPRLRPFKSSLA